MSEEMLFRERKLILARESSYGTDVIDLANNLAVARRYAALTKVDAVANGDTRERAILRPSFSQNRSQHRARNLTWTMEGIIPCPAVAGNAPLDLDHLLVASGMTEALVASTTSTYTLSTTQTAGLTAYMWARYADSYVWRFIYGTGIRGNMTMTGSIRDFDTFSFVGESNNFPYATTGNALAKGWSRALAYFDTDGTILLDKDGAGITYTGVETADDPRGLMLEPSSILTIDSVAFPISDYTLGFGNGIRVKEATSASHYGTAGTHRGSRKVVLEFTLQASGASLNKALDALHLNSEVASTLVSTDGLGSGGTTFTRSFPKLQIIGVEGPSDAEGFASWKVMCAANANSHLVGDNEMSMVWSVTA